MQTQGGKIKGNCETDSNSARSVCSLTSNKITGYEDSFGLQALLPLDLAQQERAFFSFRQLLPTGVLTGPGVLYMGEQISDKIGSLL